MIELKITTLERRDDSGTLLYSVQYQVTCRMQEVRTMLHTT